MSIFLVLAVYILALNVNTLTVNIPGVTFLPSSSPDHCKNTPLSRVPPNSLRVTTPGPESGFVKRLVF